MFLSFQIPWYVFLLATLLAVLLSFVVYRYTVPPVSRRLRVILTVLRSAALLLLIFALCEPVFTLIRRAFAPPSIAVLIDNSLSMTLTDDAGDRERTLRSLLSAPAWKQLSESRVHFFTFSPSLRECNLDSLKLNGASTDIASALRSLRQKSIPQLKAVVLLSDGNYNSGENPLYESDKMEVPIFSVGVGDSLEQKDILIKKISTNSVAYVQSRVPLDASIKVSGFQNKRLAVTLSEDGKLLDQQFIMVSSAAAGAPSEYPVHFSFTPASDGTKKYTVAVSALEGEVTKKNNTSSVLVKVLKNKIRVVVIAGAPAADVAAVMQSLHTDPNVDARLVVQQANGLFGIPARGIASRQLSQIIGEETPECIVLIGFPNDGTSSSSLQFIAGPSHSFPLLFIAGRTVNLQKLRQIEPLLPFTIISDRIDEQSVFPNPSQLYQYHVLLQTSENSLEVWGKLPPLFSSVATFRAKPEALVLSTMKVQGVPLDNPLLLARSGGGTKSFAVAGYGLWRWRLLAGQSDGTEKFFDPWFSNVVRWLVTRDDNKQVRVETTKDIFSQGEAVDFLGQVYNANYEPIENADLHVNVLSLLSHQRFETILEPVVKGRYEGTIESLPEGDYSFTATAGAGGTEIGSAQGRFSVGEQSAEYADTKMNKPLLQQIAAVSGGEYADAGQFEKFVHDIASRPFMKPEEETTAREFELWNLPALLSVIVALLGTEWFLRKRSGML